MKKNEWIEFLNKQVEDFKNILNDFDENYDADEKFFERIDGKIGEIKGMLNKNLKKEMKNRFDTYVEIHKMDAENNNKKIFYKMQVYQHVVALNALTDDVNRVFEEDLKMKINS